jgi:hypothetical protein
VSDQKETQWYSNITDSQVVIDSHGRIMDGGSAKELEVTPQTKRAVDNGQLVVIDAPAEQEEEPGNPAYLGEYENIGENAKGEVVTDEGEVIEDVPGAPLPKTSEDDKPKAKKKSR